jgi:hypothetical protein
MNLLLFFVLGLAGSALQVFAGSWGPWVPLMVPLLGSLVVLRSPRPHLPWRLAGLALGGAALSLEPTGTGLIALGLAAWLMLPLRDSLYVEHWQVQLLLAAVCVAIWLGARQIAVWLGSAPAIALDRTLLIAALMSTCLAPILHAVWEGMDRWFPGLHLVTRTTHLGWPGGTGR